MSNADTPAAEYTVTLDVKKAVKLENSRGEVKVFRTYATAERHARLAGAVGWHNAVVVKHGR